MRELFKTVSITSNKNSANTIQLTYYLLTDSVSEEFCDLKVYGVEIDKVSEQKSEKKIIPDLFFTKGEAEDFLQRISDRNVTPTELKYEVSKYIDDRLRPCSVKSV